ncbi:MAG: type I-E CRISPR-associated protein Cse1/CasA [Bacteroidia bacterium]|nr:type I-E CRISPR-associated protein Cse1/CasA [Bacteroidia bacterium]NCC88758.1 type I-E CRISPR-associated protein Cse1/CasA [Spirochaetia bacterium]
MNLLHDAWIPVKRRDSHKRELIRPCDLTNGIDEDPYHSIDAVRPDFKESLLQFLIGLIQTVMTPTSEVEWVALFRNPPSQDVLSEAMEKELEYFELVGDTVSFMQEPSLHDAKIKPIASLLIDSPGDNTIEMNTDHFVKRDGVKGLCEACTATALYTLNVNAPAGGAGIRTSLRGGGPLTAIIIPDGYDKAFDTLWHLVWLNVLVQKDQERTQCNSSLIRPEAKYPWIGNIKVSNEKGSETTAKHIHPFQTYWGMPRRINLIGCKTSIGTCDVCGTENVLLYQYYKSLPWGINYGEGIIHPLSPYYSDKDGLKLPVHPQPGGFTYRHWPLYIASNSSLNPRPITLQVLDRRLRDLKKSMVECGVRVKVSGYDMDNMKARCWYESEMPYWLVPVEIREELVEHSTRLAESANAIAKNTNNAVKESWLNPGAKVRGDLSYLESEFWASTEHEYYQRIRKCEELMNHGDIDYQGMYETWLQYLNRASLRIFDEYAEQVSLDSGKSKSGIPRVITARNALIGNNMGKKIREKILGLPTKPTKKTKEDV